MRPGEGHHLVVGVDRLGRFAGTDGDRRQTRHEDLAAEHHLGKRKDEGVHRDPGPRLTVGEEVVDPRGRGALEGVVAGSGAELSFESGEVLGQFVEQRRVDGVLEDRVAVGLDPVEVLVE